jgi:glycosyltransferase involved in cell wall biosynthesis
MREVARKLNYRPFPHMHLAAGFEWLALKKTGAVLCNSSYTDECVGGLNKNKPRIFNAVRSSFFDLCPEPESQSTYQPINSSTEESASPILLCIGHIHSYKNQIGLIHALDSFPSIGKFKLLFAGNCCSDSAYGRAFLKEIASRDWCEHVGRLELAELQKMLCHCAGVIHPTLEDSFGLAVAEAQVSGVPVAASAVGGIPDLIKHGETGLLFDPQNPEDIRQKVMDLLDPVISGKLAQNARAYAEAQYRPEVIARRHLELYGKLLSGDPLEYE